MIRRIPRINTTCVSNIHPKKDRTMEFDKELNFEATELRLGLPGTKESEKQPPKALKSNKRAFSDVNQEEFASKDSSQIVSHVQKSDEEIPSSPPKAQVVGWPPLRSHRKNCFQPIKQMEAAEAAGVYLKVSMDGAPYLRKIDLKIYKGYPELLKALEEMFKFFSAGEFSEKGGYSGSEFVPTYEDTDGDWMLVGDVPWDMFISSCKRLRIMKETEARGLACTVKIPNFRLTRKDGEEKETISLQEYQQKRRWGY